MQGLLAGALAASDTIGFNPNLGVSLEFRLQPGLAAAPLLSPRAAATCLKLGPALGGHFQASSLGPWGASGAIVCKACFWGLKCRRVLEVPFVLSLMGQFQATNSRPRGQPSALAVAALQRYRL